MAYTNNSCITQWVRLGQDNWPISGSQQGFPAGQLPCGEICQWVKLQNSPYTPPNGTKQIIHVNDLRFFYRISPNGSNPATIVPNSFISSYTFPQTDSRCVVEYKRYANI